MINSCKLEFTTIYPFLTQQSQLSLHHMVKRSQLLHNYYAFYARMVTKRTRYLMQIFGMVRRFPLFLEFFAQTLWIGSICANVKIKKQHSAAVRIEKDMSFPDAMHLTNKQNYVALDCLLLMGTPHTFVRCSHYDMPGGGKCAHHFIFVCGVFGVSDVLSNNWFVWSFMNVLFLVGCNHVLWHGDFIWYRASVLPVDVDAVTKVRIS